MDEADERKKPLMDLAAERAKNTFHARGFMVGATVIDFELKGCDDPDRFETIELEKDGKRFFLESYFSRIDGSGDGIGIHAHGGTSPPKEGDGEAHVAGEDAWVDATYESYWEGMHAKNPTECLLRLKELIEEHKMDIKAIKDRIRRLYPPGDITRQVIAVRKINETVKQMYGGKTP